MPGGWTLAIASAAILLSLLTGFAFGWFWARRRPVADVAAIEDSIEPTLLKGCPALVIDDDARVLDATVAALAALGYEPLPCHGPAAVPAMLRARRDIGLIVSDVQMPGIDGPALVAAIRELHPHVPVLFVTALADDGLGDAFEGHPVLRKPFTSAALANALDRLRSPVQTGANR